MIITVDLALRVNKSFLVERDAVSMELQKQPQKVSFDIKVRPTFGIKGKLFFSEKTQKLIRNFLMRFIDWIVF